MKARSMDDQMSDTPTAYVRRAGSKMESSATSEERSQGKREHRQTLSPPNLGPTPGTKPSRPRPKAPPSAAAAAAAAAAGW